MPTTVTLKKLLHGKRWENKSPALVQNNQGSCFAFNDKDMTNQNDVFWVQTSSQIYYYDGNEDSWLQIPTSGASGSSQAGMCNTYSALSAPAGVYTQTATAGTTTTITTNRTILKDCGGLRIRVVAGTGVGYDSTITSNTIGANAVLTVPANAVAFDNTTQYQIYGGSLWFVNAGSGFGFVVYDVITNTWTTRSTTGLPASWFTNGFLITTGGSNIEFATGTATAGGSTTLTNSGKAWLTNMWANYQVRIKSGTGAGQIRTISSNTGTVLTVSAAWTVTPDATSVYAIQGNDDHFYLLGNTAITMYRYTVSTNTWATLSPTVARGNPNSGGGVSNWVQGVTGWDSETPANLTQSGGIVKQNGRYIYSFRGSNQTILDVYDIASNTWINNHTYAYQQDTIPTGASSVICNGIIYIQRDVAGRFLAFNIAKNELEPATTNLQPQGSVLEGAKIFIQKFNDGGTTLNFLYMLSHTSTVLQRVLLI